MSLETVHNLDPETVAKLQDLAQINLDSRDGFRHAAEQLEGEPVTQLFRRLAEERARQAKELQHYVAINEQEPQRKGSFAAAVHRTWMSIRGSLSGNDLHAVLAEAERGEDHIKEAYEDVLKKTAGSAVNDVLQRQYAAVKQGHDLVRELRDSTKGPR